jgi:hypothetical protein
MDTERLAAKLHLASPRQALIVAAPEAFAPMLAHLADALAAQVDVERRGDDRYDYVHVFVREAAQAPELLTGAADAVAEGGLLWVSYPKTASKRYASDLSRDSDAWAPLYERNLEPVRQVAIDADWSALRFRPVGEIASFTRGFARSEAGKRRSGS